MKTLAIILLFAFVGCVGPDKERKVRVRPFFSLEHRHSHGWEGRLGANFYTKDWKIRGYWAPVGGLTDHNSQKISLDNPLAFGLMIEGR